MRGTKILIVIVLAAFVLLPRFMLAQSQTFRYANVTYRLPAGWKVDKGYEYLPYYPDPKNGTHAVRMTISRPDYSRGKYHYEAVKRISAIMSGTSVINVDGPREISLPGGVTGILASSVRFQGAEYAGVYSCSLMAVIDLGDKFQVVSAESSDENAFGKAKDGAEQLIASMVFDGAGGTASQASPPVTLEGVDKAPEDIPYPLSTISTSDMDAAAEAAAKAVKAGGKDAFPALVFAAVQSGFTIRNSKNGIVKYPASGKGNGYSMTAIELILYNDLEQSGFTMEFDSLCRELGGQFSRIFDNAKIDLRSGLLHGLSAAASSKQKPVRFMARFLAALGRNAAEPYDLLAGNPPKNAQLDAVQALFIMRASIGQIAAATSLRIDQGSDLPEPHPAPDPLPGQHASGPSMPDPAAEPSSSSSGAAGLQLVPLSGTVEDAVVGAQTGMVGEGLNVIEGILEKGGKEEIGDKAFKLNQTLTIIKFVATYACLKAEFELKGEGKKGVLERTKNRKPGEEKSVQVKFFLDTAKWMQLMKDYRTLIAITFKIDVDMPKAGPLSALEVEWTLPGFDRKNLRRNIAYLEGEKDAEGKSDFRRSVTDSEGRTSVKLIGQPQVEDMDIENISIVPVRKSVLVQATIQVKRPEAGQDLVDAVSAAWGVFPVSGLTKNYKSGNETVDFLAWMTPLMETFYRMKCLAPKAYRVPVIDWEFAGYQVDVAIDISGSGQEALPSINGSFRWSVSRQLLAEDIEMAGDKFPVLDPELIKMMGLEQPSQKNFVQWTPEPAEIKVQDYTIKEGDDVSCLDPKKKVRFMDRENWTAQPPKPTYGKAPGIGGVRVSFDLDKKTYRISLPGIGTAAAGTEVLYTASHKSGTSAPEVTDQKQYITTFFFNLSSKAPASDGSLGPTIELPLPPSGPGGRFPLIEGRKSLTDVMRVPFGPVTVTYSWRIEPLQGKSTEARGRTWDPWKGLDLTGPYTVEMDSGWEPGSNDMASCHPVAYNVQPLPVRRAAPGTNAQAVLPPTPGPDPAAKNPARE